jgi:molecular chaperone GrpE
MPSGKTRGQQRVEEIDISPAKLLADIETLKTELADARASGEEYLNALQRERAEFQNFRRRSQEERQTVADDFDLAIEARPESISTDPWFDGIAAIDRKLRVLLESEGVTPIDAMPGRQFDPREHEAIVNVPGTGRPEGEIVDELRRGYRLRDRVLRAALVAVAAPPPDAPVEPAAAPPPPAGAGEPVRGTHKQRPN